MVPGGGVSEMLFNDEAGAQMDVRHQQRSVHHGVDPRRRELFWRSAAWEMACPAASDDVSFAWKLPEHLAAVGWDNAALWVVAGPHVSSAGVPAGIYLGFYLVSRAWLAGRSPKTRLYLPRSDRDRDPYQPIVYPQQANVQDGYSQGATQDWDDVFQP